MTINGQTIMEIINEKFAEQYSSFESLSAESKELISSLTIAVLKLAIYIVGIIVCWLISIINKIILKACFREQIRKDLTDPQNRKSSVKLTSRLVGLCFAFLSFIMLIVVCYFPLLGVINLTDVTLREVQTIEMELENKDSKDYEQIDYEGIRAAINKSFLYKISKIGADKSSGVTLASQYVGSIISVKSSNVTTNIIKEYKLALPLLPIAFKISNDVSQNNQIDFSKLSKSEINQINRFLDKSTLLNQVSPLIKDILINALNESGKFDAELVNGIKDIDMDKEIHVVLDALQIAVEQCSNLVIEFDHLENILKDETLPDGVNNFINKLLESKFISDFGLTFISDKIIESLKEDLQSLAPLFTAEKIKETLSHDVKVIMSTYQDLAKNTNLEDVIFNDQKLDLSSEGSIEAFSRALSTILNLKLVENNETLLIEFGLDKLNNESFKYDVLFDGIVPDWKLEKDNLVKVLEETLRLYNDKLKDKPNESSILEILTSKNENNEYVFMPLLNQIALSKLFTTVLINYLDANIDELTGNNIPEELKDIFKFSVFKDLTEEEFKQEVNKFVQIFECLIDMNIGNQEELNITGENIETLLNNVLTSVLIKDKESKVIKYLLSETGINEELETLGVELNYESVDWKIERPALIKIFKSVLSFDDLSNIFNDRNEENKEKIVDLFVSFTESQIFGNAIYPLLEKATKELGYTINFTDEDKYQIELNGWNKEITTLFAIVDDCQNLLTIENFDSLSGTQVTEIMIKASESVIASKIIGLTLDEILGPNNLDILPKNSDGSTKYDLSNPAILKDISESLGALIDLNRSVSDFNASADDGQLANKVSNALGVIQESDTVKEMVVEYLNIEVENIDDMNLNDDAEVITNIYNEYTNSPSDFDINEHPELAEELNNSTVAKALLEMLGII